MNWFQIDTFMWWFTVPWFSMTGQAVLWIDFKLILLCDDSQFFPLIFTWVVSCELISNWYFYVMIHSVANALLKYASVVNWFQIDTFMWWFTVEYIDEEIQWKLWIDFKLILLCDDSQLMLVVIFRLICCELISNWYFYVMIHSHRL